MRFFINNIYVQKQFFKCNYQIYIHTFRLIYNLDTYFFGYYCCCVVNTSLIQKLQEHSSSHILLLLVGLSFSPGGLFLRSPENLDGSCTMGLPSSKSVIGADDTYSLPTSTSGKLTFLGAGMAEHGHGLGTPIHFQRSSGYLMLDQLIGAGVEECVLLLRLHHFHALK